MEQEIMSSNSGKNKKTLIIGGAVIVVLAAAAYFSYGFFAKKTGEQLAENLLEGQLGGQVDIDANDDSASIKTDQGSLSLGQAAKWPADMPSDIPEFKAGNLIMAGTALTGGSGWQVVAENVKQEDFVSYHEALKSKGWSDVGIFQGEIGAIQMTKEEMMLWAGFNGGDGSFSLTVVVNESGQ